MEPWLMARWKARIKFLLSVIELLFYLLQLRRYKAKCVKTRCLQEGWVSFSQDFRGSGRHPVNILIPLERKLIALQLCRWQFYTMKLCSRLLVLYCQNWYETRHI